MIFKGKDVIEHTKRLKTLMHKNPNFKNSDTRLDIMVYQLGEAVKMFKIYGVAYKENEGKLKGYETEGKLCLANLIIQLEMFCISRDIDFNQLRDTGYEHLKIKLDEVHANGGQMI